MPDRLYQAIEGAIGLELDGRVFERCAVDLLRKAYYADLRGTPHERDAGMDGISGPDSDPEFILIATTSNDFARNLRSSVKRYVGAGGRGRTVVFATTRKVTGERRLRLRRELLDRWHMQLREVHDQGDFIHLLYHDPQWRRGLLNVAGIAKTLSRFPANARPTPLTHPAGHAQCDFGQARAVIGGVEQAIHYFALDLAHSDGCFVNAYPAESSEAFCDGHVAAFSFLGGVPRSILYDNTRLAVAKIMGDGRRRRTRVFSELVSHYLFEDRFGRRSLEITSNLVFNE